MKGCKAKLAKEKMREVKSRGNQAQVSNNPFPVESPGPQVVTTHVRYSGTEEAH